MSQPIESLNRIYAAVDYMTNLECQDTMMIVEMSQSMIDDLIVKGALRPMVEYVKMYCDVIDGPDDAQRITDDIGE